MLVTLPDLYTLSLLCPESASIMGNANVLPNHAHTDPIGDLESLSNRISSHLSSISFPSTMSQSEYRKLQKKTDGGTLLVTIPTAFAQAIPLQKSDVVRITLEGKTVRLEKV